MENNNKKSPIGVILIVLLFFVLGVAGGYYLNEKEIINLNKKTESSKKEEKANNKEVTKSEEKKEIDANSEQIKNLITTITSSNRAYCGYYGLFTDKKMTPKDITPEDKMLVMISELYHRGSYEGASYKKEEVESLYKSIFGKNESFSPIDVKACPSFIYNQTNNTFVVGESNCGGTCDIFTTKHQVTKAYQIEDGLEVYVSVVFWDRDTQKFYSDYNKTNVIKEITNLSDLGEENMSVDIEKGTSYKVTFKLEDANYVFVSAEPINDK